MEMSGEERIPASQAATWKALNDPEMLKACVPGCESIENVAQNEFQVLMVARIGPVSAKLRTALLAIQTGDAPDAHGWARSIELD